jgi:hypothetical protein
MKIDLSWLNISYTVLQHELFLNCSLFYQIIILKKPGFEKISENTLQITGKHLSVHDKYRKLTKHRQWEDYYHSIQH